MNTYRLKYTKEIIPGLKDAVFSDVMKQISFLDDYLLVENNYLNILKKAFYENKLFYFDLQFIFKIKPEHKKYYSENELNFLLSIIQHPKKSQRYDLTEILVFAKLILRENLSGDILNDKKNVIFGYTYDYESLLILDEIPIPLAQLIETSDFKCELF